MTGISICLASYNGARFIGQQIESIRTQLTPDDEIIIADDGSTDNTVNIINQFGDPRIRLILNSQKEGFVRNFEKLLTLAKGKYIFLSDQDDVWEKEKISSVLQCLESYDLVLTDCSIINEQGEKLLDSYFHAKKSRRGIVKNLIRNSYMGCCMAFHRKVLDKVLPFPCDLVAHDQWIGLIAEKYFRVYFLNELLVMYRRHGKNYSFTGEKSPYGLLEKINYRLNMLYNLSNR
jgi:glycosyltransferase involved in cell wall biosynthesis